MDVVKREARPTSPFDLFSRFDAMFDEWTRTLPFRRGPERWFGLGDDIIRVDEYRDGDTLVIRAEVPGIDPDKDVELTVTDGMLHISAHRQKEEREDRDGYLRHEIRSGTMRRSLPLPEGVSEDAIQATYKNGILEVRVPVPQPPEETKPKRIPVQKEPDTSG